MSIAEFIYNRRMIHCVKKVLTGIAVGIANIIPGVSGGTIAVVFGVYPDLIHLAAFDIQKIKADRKNYICLLCGIAFGILLFAKLFKFLYEQFPIQTNFFFVGLIIGSVFLIFEMLRDKPPVKKSAAAVKLFWFLAGLGIMILVYFFKERAAGAGTAIETVTVKNFFILFFAGVAGAVAMVIPGISGSFILLILGVYYPVIKAVTEFNMPVLCTVGLGIIAGTFLSARLIQFLLNRYPKTTYAFILGLVAGSILHIFPHICQPFKMRLISALCLLAGYVLITAFERTKSPKKL